MQALTLRGRTDRRYRKAYEDYVRAMRAEFPGMTFHGDTFTPGQTKMMLAQFMQFVFFGGLAISLIGRSMLPEPASKFLENNQLVVLGACFMCNIAAGNLLNTGAFEVSYNGADVWSKIDAGRFPQMDELRTALSAVIASSS